MTIEAIKEAEMLAAASGMKVSTTVGDRMIVALLETCKEQQELILQLQRDNIENLSRIKKLEQGNWTNG